MLCWRFPCCCPWFLDSIKCMHSLTGLSLLIHFWFLSGNIQWCHAVIVSGMTYELEVRREFEEFLSFSVLSACLVCWAAGRQSVSAGTWSEDGEMIFVTWGVHLFSLLGNADKWFWTILPTSTYFDNLLYLRESLKCTWNIRVKVKIVHHLQVVTKYIFLDTDFSHLKLVTFR